MALIIEITAGIQSGQKFKLVDGTTLGRKKTDILFKDPNVSSFHAVIKFDPNGIPVIEDQGSRNGIVVNGEVVRKLALYPMTEFLIGDTNCIVKFISDEDLEKLFPSKTWQNQLADYFQDLSDLAPLEPEEILAFSPKIELRIVEGPMADQTLVLGYGPRTFGFLSLDTPLLEPDIPEVAFKITPGLNGAKIINYSLDQITLNDKIFESSPLVSGDKIKAGNSVIKVFYILQENS